MYVFMQVLSSAFPTNEGVSGIEHAFQGICAKRPLAL